MKIGVDIDGVISDFADRILAYAEWYDSFILNKKGRDLNIEGEYYKQYNWTTQERHNFFDQYEVKISLEAQIMPLCKEVLEYIKSNNHEIIILTARDTYNDKMIEVAQNMLDNNHIPYDKIYWKLESKIEMCKNLNIDIMIEDKPDTCEKLADIGIKSIYFKGINGREVKKNDKIITVTNWPQIYRYFCNMK